MKLVLVLLPFIALTAWAEDESLTTIHRIETETADRIQTRVLDPILGAGQSSVFVKLRLEVKREYEYSDRSGEGRSTKMRSKMEIGVGTTMVASPFQEVTEAFSGFGFSGTPTHLKAANVPWQESSEQKQNQEASQTKGVKEERYAMWTYHKDFRVIILHDAKVPQSKLSSVRSALLAIYKLEYPKIDFHPVEFSALK